HDEILKQRIEDGLYDDEYYWYGLTMRARAIIYAKDRVSVSDLSTYEDLSNEKWNDKIAIRSSSNLYNISWIASMMMNHGVSNTEIFLNQFVDRFYRTPAGNDRDQAKLVASNVGADIAIMNTYYMGLLLNASSEYEREVGASLGVFFPNQGDNESGTHINISAAGIVKASNQVEESIQFIRFLTSDDAQSHFTNVNYEYPVNPQTTWNELLVSWGTFKRQTLDLNILGNYHEQAYELMIGAGWL
ncbi:MAG: extracellular solute-binding protein, partial [Acholeplasmataceae bacterium]